ncbi:MAG: hypothetical protein Q9226_003580 [Calogaya cf. arnoldii]
MGSYPRPHWFLVRPDNTITPLIAVDELPSNIYIAGVPAAMSLVDTKSMESVGVRERSVGTYDVHGLPAATPATKRSDSEEYAKISSESGTDLPFQKSVSAFESGTEEGSEEGAKETLLEPPSSKLPQPADVKTVQEQALRSSETSSSHPQVKVEEAADVEKWRQDVETPDVTQARIDALVAANEPTPEGAKQTPQDENSRSDRAKAGLVPGKKVYCSHWIRSGDCDFVQQGCLYKHEMPDDDTLRAIGIRALPSWYIAAHPEKARKRGWGSGSRAGEPSFPSSTWKPSTAPFPAPSTGSFQMSLQAHGPPFQPSGRFGHPAKAGPPFMRTQAPYPHTFTQPPIVSRADQQFRFPRVQELSDHQYEQWQAGTLDRPSGLQLVQKPRSPGYKTFPFPVPAPIPTPTSRTSHGEPKPLWTPRQSKFSMVTEEGSSEPIKQEVVETSGPEPAAKKVEGEAVKRFFSGVSTQKDQVSQLSNAQARPESASLPKDVHHAVKPKAITSHATGKNNGFAPLEPVSVPEPVPPKSARRELKPDFSSKPFDQAPTGHQQAPWQMFLRTAREGQGSGRSKPLERNNQTRSVIKKEAKELLRNDSTTFKNHYQIRADEIFGRKDVTEDNKKKLSSSPEGKPKAKRALQERAPLVDCLLDYED